MRLPTTRTQAKLSMEQAADAIHRIVAMLTYITLYGRRAASLSHVLLEEAEHAQGQAVARFWDVDYEGAQEFSAASLLLAEATKSVLLVETQRSEIDLPISVPEKSGKGDMHAGGGIGTRLARMEGLLSHLHFIITRGPFDTEARTQLQKLHTCGETLCARAHDALAGGGNEDAADLVQAAETIARSTRHLLRSYSAMRLSY